MPTFKDLQDRIALDYLNRTDLMPEVKRAINNSIKCYEASRFWFNEASTATTTTANTSYIGVPSDFLALDRLELTYSGSTEDLTEEDFDTIRRMNAVTAVAVPTHFAYRGDRFELALIPDSAYATNCYYIKSLPTLSADTDTNAWCNEVQNLIVHHATLDIMSCNLFVATPQRIQYHQAMLQMAQKELNLRNTLRLTKKLRATSF